MKCPKCHYLGFETGDRCRNCGYDFSLLAGAPTGPSNQGPPTRRGDDVDATTSHVDGRATDAFDRLALAGPDPMAKAGPDEAVDHLADMPLQLGEPDAAVREIRLKANPAADADAARPYARPRVAPTSPDTLPLFTGASLDDEPLVRFPSPPRAPLSVRRTPDAPRFRPPVIIRREESPEAPSLALEAEPPAPVSRPFSRALTLALEPCSSAARVGAAVLDAVLLASIDLIVVYFTLRMAALSIGEWRLLPPVPLVLFLLLLNVAYAVAFTAIGGQTIGKMAARIRVVSDDGREVAPALAFRRTLGAAASIVTLGGTFLPALIGSERRAVHDRLAHTRVVSLPVA
jgi:uncharacterized RDD family membrane protein YckC